MLSKCFNPTCHKKLDYRAALSPAFRKQEVARVYNELAGGK
jgi:hypothetical protein